MNNIYENSRIPACSKTSDCIDENNSHESIYVNTDILKNRNKTETVISKTSGVSNRCYILATLFLSLLCVLLLTAITLLWVKFTAERNQLQTSYNNLTVETDQLQMRYNNLIIERDQIQTSYNILTTEKDGYQNKLSNIEKDITKPGWAYFNGSIYYISTAKKNWNDSRKDCNDRGADLVIIKSKEEQGFVDILKKEQGTWIGLTDQEVKNSWKWTDNSALTSGHWKRGEPDGRNEHCVISDTDPMWNWADYSCNFEFIWICEKRIVS